MAVTDGNWEFDKFDDGSTSKLIYRLAIANHRAKKI